MIIMFNTNNNIPKKVTYGDPCRGQKASHQITNTKYFVLFLLS